MSASPASSARVSESRSAPAVLSSLGSEVVRHDFSARLSNESFPVFRSKFHGWATFPLGDPNAPAARLAASAYLSPVSESWALLYPLGPEVWRLVVMSAHPESLTLGQLDEYRQLLERVASFFVSEQRRLRLGDPTEG